MRLRQAARPIALLFSLMPLALIQGQEATDWPGFRGTGATGIANGFRTAVAWDLANPDQKQVLWRKEIPGLGHSCPTIVGNRLFIATAVAEGEESELQVGRGGNIKAAQEDAVHKWLVLCFDKWTGEELWRKVAAEGKPKATRHTKATHANTTITISGDNVVAFFGSEGLYCYDLDGKLKWERDLGIVDISKYGIGWGYASSPAIRDNRIVLVCDDPNEPFVAAYELATGDEIWRTGREGDCERSWGTPLIYEGGDKVQVVVNGWPWIVAYDLVSGSETWRIESGGDNPIPSPFIANGKIYLTNAHGAKSPVMAMRLDAAGNVSEAEKPEDAGLVWRIERGGAYMSTPIVVEEYLYVADTKGAMRCFLAETGERLFQERLPDSPYIVASLVAADSRIYCSTEDGMVHVIEAGPELNILASSSLGEPCLATPAISEGVLFFRTQSSLIAIRPSDSDEDESP